jgi:lipoprotein-releasing system permease protein
MRQNFVIFTALRYFRARRRSKGFTSSLLSILGVAVGIITLTTVIAVMNGFQLNYINNLLEVSSYHLQITASNGHELPPAILAQLEKIPEIDAVVPFREFQVMLDRTSERSETMPGVLRALDYNRALDDESFIRHLYGEKYPKDDFAVMKNDFSITEKNTVIIGYLLSQYLGVQRGSTIIISSINDLAFNTNSPLQTAAVSRRFTISNIFKSGYKDIDQFYLFISLENSDQFLDNAASAAQFPLHYGIKLKNRFQEEQVKTEIEKYLDPASYQVKTWRDFNRSYFGALLMEKMIMMLLVGLIFIVVGFNIFNSLRRIVYEKYEEIALLKAIGASPRKIRTIFIFEGLLIGFFGGLIGIVIGLFVANHINELFAFFTDIVNLLLRLIEQVCLAFGIELGLGHIESPFSPRIFYFREVPSVVIFEEALVMYLFAVMSAAGAAIIASKKISEVKPSEVLRYE